jgi:hypothetical protein
LGSWAAEDGWMGRRRRRRKRRKRSLGEKEQVMNNVNFDVEPEGKS